MRLLVAAVLGAVIVIVVGALALDGILSYWDVSIFPESWWPDSWAAPDSWAEWRDITIVFMGFLSTLALFLVVVMLGAIVFLLLTIRRLLKDNVAPAVDSLKDSIDSVRGTTEFVGETAVSPIIRLYSVINGVRSGMGAVTNLKQRVSDRRKK